MSNTIFNKFSKAIQNLYEVLESLFFFESSIFSKSGPESATLSQLKYDIEIVDRFVNIIKFYDVVAFELLIDLNLGVKCIFGVLVFVDFIFSQYFDSHFLLGAVFYPKKDLRESSRAKLTTEEDNVLPYSLFCISSHTYH